MSVRKVSDLEGLNFDQFYTDQELSNRLLNSLIEISYPEQIETELGDKYAYSYKSMYTKYNDIKYNILRTILSGDDPDNPQIHFHTSAFFHDTIYGLCSFYLSGNFYLNLEYSDDEIEEGQRDATRRSSGTGYEMYIRTAENTLCAVGDGSNNIYANDNNIIAKSTNNITGINNNITGTNITLNSNNTQIKNNLYVENDVYGKFFRGIALSAYWADLAEFYSSDSLYEPGTLICFGGEKEITIADKKANGVISNQPAIAMNSTIEDTQIKLPITLAGRTPIKIINKVNKFDRIVISNIPGIGIAKKYSTNNEKIIAISLQDNSNDEIKMVECITKFNLD